MTWKKALLALAFGFLLGGFAGAVFGALNVWVHQPPATDPMLKSQLLADAISEAMNSAVLYALAGAPAMLGLAWAWAAYRTRDR